LCAHHIVKLIEVLASASVAIDRYRRTVDDMQYAVSVTAKSKCIPAEAIRFPQTKPNKS
jgi:hypothetical protein